MCDGLSSSDDDQGTNTCKPSLVVKSREASRSEESYVLPRNFQVPRREGLNSFQGRQICKPSLVVKPREELLALVFLGLGSSKRELHLSKM